MTIAVSAASYHLYEKRFLDLRSKFRNKKARPHKRSRA